MEQVNIHTPVGQLVIERPGRLHLFERLGLDYCCAGKLPLGEACRAAGIDTDEVLAQLEACDAAETDTDEVNPATLTLSELADHIEKTHHVYLRRELPRLGQMVEKVAQVHGNDHTWLADLRLVFSGLVAELDMHMMKEERILFPLVRELENAESLPDFHCGSVDNPIAAMEQEHDNAAAALGHLRQLSGGFNPPENACNTFRELLQGLAELEADLHEHIHKENNILFARASKVESQLLGFRPGSAV